MKETLADAIPDSGPVVVINVAASEGGALSVLNDLYDQLVRQPREYPVYLLHSSGHLEPRGQVVPIKRSWIKRSWAHRLFWEWVVAPKEIRRLAAQTVVSLQNLAVPFIKNDLLLVHNPIPFSGARFRLTAQPKLWIYENVIGRLILSSVRRSRLTVVQTEWMKRALIQSLGEGEGRIRVIPPQLSEASINSIPPSDSSRDPVRQSVEFFYPASHAVYKDHACVVRACELLVDADPGRFTVTFTLQGTETKHIRVLREQVNRLGLPVRFVGNLGRAEVFAHLADSILVFPSRIETFGLPLLEARTACAEVIAADLPYAREVLAGYTRAEFFSPGDASELAAVMARHIRD